MLGILLELNILEKDVDESVEVDMTSEDENETLVVSNEGAVLESTATLDEVDEDEAFIIELMAMHPNDDDIVVEDLEEVCVEVEGTVDHGGEEGVRLLLC